MYISKINQNIIVNFNFNEWIDRPLTKNDKQLLITALNLHYDNLKFPTLKKILSEFYIESINKVVRINGKQARVTYLIDTYQI